MALSLDFHQTRNLSRNKFAHVARQVEGLCFSYLSSKINIFRGAEVKYNKSDALKHIWH